MERWIYAVISVVMIGLQGCGSGGEIALSVAKELHETLEERHIGVEETNVTVLLQKELTNIHAEKTILDGTIIETNRTQSTDASSVDMVTIEKFGEDKTVPTAMSDSAKAIVGNWYGSNSTMSMILQLRADGTYRAFEHLPMIYHQGKKRPKSKKHQKRHGNDPKSANMGRSLLSEGTWRLSRHKTYVVLQRADNEASLILRHHFPYLVAPSGVVLSGGSSIDRERIVSVDVRQERVEVKVPVGRIDAVLHKPLVGVIPDYFVILAAKSNGQRFWKSIGIAPPGYHFGHTLYRPSSKKGLAQWEYAKHQNSTNPHNYAVVITDGSLTKFMGDRKHFIKALQDPQALYRWFFYWKTQMLQLGQLDNGVITILVGNLLPYVLGEVQQHYKGDLSKVPAVVSQSRFPDALERNPTQTLAGVFQVMDYMRMKYAPNVRLGLALKEWKAQGMQDEVPDGGWENDPGVEAMAALINSMGVSWDYVGFDLKVAKEKREESVLQAHIQYFGAVAKKLLTRDGERLNHAKTWIWRSSLESDYPSFYFSHIDFLVNEANVAGMILGRGKEWRRVKRADLFPNTKYWSLKRWLEEYYTQISK